MDGNRSWTGRIGLVAAALAVLVWTSAAQAHKLYVFAWTEGDTVHTESYFSKSKKVSQGTVKVYAVSGELLLEGRTDDQGAFSFTIPKKTALRVVTEAGMGHRGEFLLPAEELPDRPPEDVKSSPPRAVLSESVSPPDHGPSASDSLQVDPGQVRKIMTEVLDDRLKPIIRDLAALKKDRGPGITEIFGGIGYIFGMMGLVIYFRYRKKR